ncbi:Gamma carbonic anhydrase-like 1, mitochondrial [Linum perenne]
MLPLGCVSSGLPAETSIERYVSIGAYCLLRSCTIEPECIIGQHSILMEGSLVETHSILEAGSVVPPGRRIPTGELWAGNPARFVRTLTHEETLEIPKLAVAINDLSNAYFSEFLPYSTVYLEVEKLKKKLEISI